MSDRSLLSLFVDFRERQVLVTGSGLAAADAARTLLEHGAEVVLVAPEQGDLVQPFADDERLRVILAEPAAEHLEGCFLLVAASEDASLDEPVLNAARAASILAVTPGTDEGAAYLGTSRSRGGLAVAVTTRGACPELEAQLADRAAEGLTPAHETLARVLGDVREKLAARFPDDERRALIWADLLDENSPVLALLRAGDEDDAMELAERMAWGTG